MIPLLQLDFPPWSKNNRLYSQPIILEYQVLWFHKDNHFHSKIFRYLNYHIIFHEEGHHSSGIKIFWILSLRLFLFSNWFFWVLDINHPSLLLENLLRLLRHTHYLVLWLFTLRFSNQSASQHKNIIVEDDLYTYQGQIWYCIAYQKTSL